jgi:hypothetical protein
MNNSKKPDFDNQDDFQELCKKGLRWWDIQGLPRVKVNPQTLAVIPPTEQI